MDRRTLTLPIMCIALIACGGSAQTSPSGNQPISTASGASIPTTTITAGTPDATPHASAPAATPTVPPATAPGGSTDHRLVYIQGNNVWIAAPDGTDSRPLTTDGTDSDRYHDPSWSGDGTIVALRGSRTLVHLDRVGQSLAAPASLIALENGVEGLAVAPDGARVAYVTTGFGTEVDPRFGTPSGTFIYGGMDVAGLDGTSVPGAAAAGYLYPDWLDTEHLVGSDGNELFLDTVGPDEPTVWVSLSDGCLTDFDCPAGDEAAASLSRPVVSGDGQVLAYSYRPYFGPAGRRVASLEAAPPATPTTRCVIAGQENHTDPGTLAPDSTAFVYDDTVFDPDTFDTTVGNGIYAMELDLDAPDCGLSTARLIVPGGSQPDWSPATP